MSTLALPSQYPRRSFSWWFALPITLLVTAAVLANAGLDPTPSATGAITDSVLVTATVGSTLDVQDQCTGNIGITVLLGVYSDGTCAINFGASNDSSVTLRARGAATPFLAPANFANEGTTCANLSGVDEAGLKVAAITPPTTNVWCPALGAAGNNTTSAHKGAPAAYANVCQSAALGITNTCTLGIGVFETGAPATAGAYTGTLQLDVLA